MTSDEKGYVLMKTPLLTYAGSSDAEDVRTYTYTLTSEDGTVSYADITLNVTITPLSFTQKYTALVYVGAEAKAGVGVEAGLSDEAELEAEVVSAAVGGGKTYLLEVDTEKDGSSTDMTISVSMSPEVFAKISSGADANLMGQKATVFSASVKGTASYMVTTGIKIKNVENMTTAKLEKLGRFLLFMMCSQSGENVVIRKLADILGLNEFDFQQDSLSASIGADVGVAEIETSLGKVSLLGFGTAFTVSTGTKEDLKANEESVFASFKVEDSVDLAKADLKLTELGSLGAGGTVVSAMSLNYLKNAESLSFGITSGIEETAGFVTQGVENKRTYTLDSSMLSLLSGSVTSKINNLQNQRLVLWSLSDYAKLANSIVTTIDEIPVTESKEKSQTLSLSFEPSLQVGVGGKLKLKLSGITGQEWESGEGVYLTDDDAIRYETQTEIDDAVSDNEINIRTLLSEAEETIIDLAVDYFKTVYGPAEDGLEYLSAKVKQVGNSVKSVYVSISKFIDDTVSTASCESYEIAAFDSVAAADAYNADDDESEASEDAAVTVGDPYTVSVMESEDSDAEIVDEFADTPLELTLSYTDEELEAAGLSAEQAGELSVYMFHEDSGAYAKVESTVDTEAQCVVAEITRSAQYILAYDTKAPEITGMEVSDPSTKPTITASIEEQSSFADFSFAIDGTELVTENEIGDYYSRANGIFSYTCTEELAEGTHTASIHIEDAAGISADQELTFEVDTTKPEITEASAEVKNRKVSISAKVSDQNPLFVYAAVQYASSQTTYSEIVELTETDGVYTAEYELERGDSFVEIQLTAMDSAGNTAEETLYVNETGVWSYQIPALSLNSEALYLKSDKTLWGWGGNSEYLFTYGMYPGKIMDDVVQAADGNGYMAAVTTDGSLYMWGKNWYGQLGTGDTTDRSVPTKILDNVAQVSLGSGSSAAITRDGELYTWGYNRDGRLGTGDTTDSSTPVKILDNVVQVSLGGYHGAAVTADGSLYMWGENSDGQLGNGTTDSLTPVKVMDNVESVSLGNYHSAAVTKNGDLYLWGYNGNGRLGTGTTRSLSYPKKVLTGVTMVSLGAKHSAAITEDGSLYVWGNNDYGQLGLGTEDSVSVPTKVMEDAEYVSCGDSFTGVLKKNGTLLLCGSNSNCQYQLGTVAESSSSTFGEMDMTEFVSVSLNATRITLKTGESFQLRVYLEDGQEITDSVTWKKLGSGVRYGALSIDEGLVTAWDHKEGKDYSGTYVLKAVYNDRTCTWCYVTIVDSESSDTDSGSSEEGDADADSGSGDDGNVDTGSCSHVWGNWQITKEATALEAGKQERTCTRCGSSETKEIEKLKATIQVNATKIPLKKKQSTTKLKVTGLAKGDYVVSWKSSNTKIVKVNNKGKLTAQKKTGKAKVTITLASGLKKIITVTVQKKAVKTKRISGVKKKLSLKKGESLTLNPVITPITSLQKVTYSSSNKKVVSVDKKGRIKAKTKGSAKITVKSGSKKLVIKVTVK